MCTVKMVFTGVSRHLHIMVGVFSLDNLFLVGKNPLPVRDMLVNFWHILLETNKSSVYWDMDGNSHLKLFSGIIIYLP